MLLEGTASTEVAHSESYNLLPASPTTKAGASHYIHLNNLIVTNFISAWTASLQNRDS